MPCKRHNHYLSSQVFLYVSGKLTREVQLFRVLYEHVVGYLKKDCMLSFLVEKSCVKLQHFATLL